MNVVEGMTVGVGRYTLEARLGGTEDAETWRARDALTEQMVAVKLLDPSMTEDCLLRFRQKCSDTRKLGGIAGVVPMLQYFEEQDRLALVSPFVPGETYRALWAGNDTYDPWYLAIGLTEAVAMLHQAKLHHGRLCPRNVLQGGTRDDAHPLAPTERHRGRMHPTALLTDHWVAEILGAGAGWGPGHSAYLAPEQLDWGDAHSRATGGKAADVWAIGVMLCEIFTGRLPYESEDRGILKQHYDAKSSRDASIRGWFEEVRASSEEVDARSEIADLIIECLVLDHRMRARLSAEEFFLRLKKLGPRAIPEDPVLHLALRSGGGAIVAGPWENRLALDAGASHSLSFQLENQGRQDEHLSLRAAWKNDRWYARVEPGDIVIAGRGHKHQILVEMGIPATPQPEPGEHVLTLVAESRSTPTRAWRQEMAAIIVKAPVALELPPETYTCERCGHSSPGRAGEACPHCGHIRGLVLGIPWENARTAASLAETLRGLLLKPSATFAEAAPGANIASGLWFALILGVISGAAALAWASPPPAIAVILLPIIICSFVFVWGALTHLSLLIVGCKGARFKDSIRTAAFVSGGIFLFGAIPWLGGIIGLGWGAVVSILALRTIHRTTGKKALFAVVLSTPFAFAIYSVLAAMIFG